MSNSGHHNSGYFNWGDFNTGDKNSGDHNSGSRNAGNFNSGHCNSGSYNSGSYNSGNYNSGYFNTNEPPVRMFNKEVNRPLKDIDFPPMHGFTLSEWIYADTMSAEEKLNTPDYESTGGYLKVYTYREAWKNFWDSLTEVDRHDFLKLPNFDAAIFKEITGIDVAVQPEKEESIIVVGGKRYKLVPID